MALIKNKIEAEDWKQTKEKLKNFNPEKELWKLKTDPTLFAKMFFKDKIGNPLTLFPYQDIIVNDQGQRVVVCIARQTGKTTMANILALHKAFWYDQCTIVVVSATKDQSSEFIKRCRDLLLSTDEKNRIFWNPVMKGVKESKTQIRIRNSGKKTYSRIISVPATDAARGYTADLVIVDEAAFIQDGDYIFNQVVEPMTQFTKGKIMLLSTPKGKHGFFWRCFNSPYWNSYQFDWRACPVNTEIEMKGKQTVMTAIEFATEYEAKFIASRNAYFSQEEIKDCIVDEIPFPLYEEELILAVDFGKVNDFCVILIGYLEKNDPDTGRVILWKRIVKPLGTDYSQIIIEIQSLCKQFGIFKIFADATGVGDGPTDVLKNSSAGLLVEAIKFSMSKKEDIYSNLKVLMQQRRLAIPDELELINQLELIEYEFTTNNKNLKLHAPKGGHDDEPDALSLLAWGLTRDLIGRTSMDFIEAHANKKEPGPKKKGKDYLLVPCMECDEYFHYYYTGKKPDPPYEFKCDLHSEE